MQRRHFLSYAWKSALLFAWGCAKKNPLSAALASEGQKEEKKIEPKIYKELAPKDLVAKIGFGSCLIHSFPQPIWKTIAAKNPDLFLMLGDNVYADSTEPFQIQHAYNAWANNADFAPYRHQFPFQAVWDDHDFGMNDMGNEHPNKEASKEIMLNFFGEPEDSPRRARPGNYSSLYYTDSKSTLQVLLLDLRWFRTPLKEGEFGQYIPNPDPDATMLGTDQWAWLEAELRKPADFRIVCSSLQFASSEHYWEKWSNYPRDKSRMIALIDELNLRNMIFITGDMHFAELTPETTPGGITVFDVTSSGLNRFSENTFVANSKRKAAFDKAASFGWLEFDWENRKLLSQVFSEQGTEVIRQEITFS